MLQGRRLRIFGRDYCAEVLHQHSATLSAPRLVIVGFQPNQMASEILKLCIASIQRHTPEDHELWVVDNGSSPKLNNWLRTIPQLNVIFNRTTPRQLRPLRAWLNPFWKPSFQGSYANAVALEMAAQIIDPRSQTMMTLHMDTLACKSGWLSYLLSKMDGGVRCVGVRLDTKRVETVHVLGMMFDFSLFQALDMTFAHAMPDYDVGDGISVRLRQAGYKLWACRNTLHQPHLVDLLPDSSPYRTLQADRSLDDDDDVIFMHLGRGILRSRGEISERHTTADEWLKFGHEVVLARQVDSRAER